MLSHGFLKVGFSLGLIIFLPVCSTLAADFEADVRPILAKNCHKCHGPSKKEGGLALHAKGPAFAGGDSGPAFLPGKSGQSRLIRYVDGTDPEGNVMPPEGAGNPLSAEQIGVLRAWIDGGAVWPETARGGTPNPPEHWAFRKPTRPPLPRVGRSDWPRNPIDFFTLASMEREGLSPSPEADRATLIRRLSLDLTGLPPTVGEVDAFLDDSRPDAYDHLVNRLLESPHHGERWGRWWLDHARYADTNGYEKDRTRSIWPFRDWVIRALNTDMPFDRFTVEQIAGDLLPDASVSQKVATGFHRNTMINEEGGIDVEEFRFASLVDRVGTTGAVWLGLTIQCAQCHTHKYDPITQREYYQFMAFLDNADEPEIDVPTDEQWKAQREIKAEIQGLESGRAGAFPGGPKAISRGQAAWEAAQAPVRWTMLAPSKVDSRKRATMTVLPDRSVLVTGDKPNNDVYEVELSTDQKGITALRLEVLTDPSLPDQGPGRAPLFSVGDFLLTEVQVNAGPDRVSLIDASADFAAEKSDAARAIDGVPDTGWSVKGGVGKSHAAVFRFQEPVNAEGEGDTPLRLTLHQEYIHQMTIGRFRVSVTTDPGPVKASGLPAEVEEALRVPVPDRTEARASLVREHYLAGAPELADLNKRIEARRKAMPAFPTTMVMRERSPEHARVTRVHQRGEFLKPADPVEPGVPSVLHPLPEDAPRDRLTFARWLVSDDNPLVGRVVMNQVWQVYFGRGLVTTPEDFGAKGARPSHPDLLDWLALEFPERGWSLKAMHRLLVTSATYRQSSKVTPELLAKDPTNTFLARGPRFRVEAETVRDIALAASGLLNREVGGPSVYPPQPEGVTATAYGGPGWPTSKGADRYRRGLYTFWKRTAPYAAFMAFDSPSSDAVCVRRERSNTPLQALTMLNDAVFQETSRALAGRVLADSKDPSDEARGALAFRLLLARSPRSDELSRIVTFARDQRSRFRSGDLDARQVAGEPGAVDLATWTTVARALLNLDEAVTKE